MTKQLTDKDLLAALSTTARNAADITFGLHRCWESGIHRRLVKLAEKGLCQKARIQRADYFYLETVAGENTNAQR